MVNDVATPRRGSWGGVGIVFVILIVLPLAGFALWTWITLNFSYASGERAGYVQKISKKGWLCKTWEGELAMANLPGTMPQIFAFSVRDEKVAQEIGRNIGQRMSLHYEQHRGIPTSCFGETAYFVTSMNLAKDPAPAAAPARIPAPPPPPAPAQP
jgi:hypothetical protein